jgi:hypothetical protein
MAEILKTWGAVIVAAIGPHIACVGTDRVLGRDASASAGGSAGNAGSLRTDASPADSPGSGGAAASSGDASSENVPDCHAGSLYDPKNCGRCGHDCLGGACLSGVCAPVLLAVAQGRISDIAVDATHAYWTSQHGVSAMPLPAGPGLSPVTVLAPGTFALGLAIDDHSVFWTDATNQEFGGTVSVVPKVGGPVSVLATGQRYPFGIAFDSTNVYWATGYVGVAYPPDSAMPGAVLRVPLGGGTPATVGTGGRPARVAIDAENVYWTDSLNGLIMKASLGGGAAVALASGQVEAMGLEAHRGQVYWTTQQSHVSGSVMRVSASGGVPDTLASGEDLPSEVAVDDSGIYWVNAGNSGTIMMLPPDGQGRPIALAFGGTAAGSAIAVDSKAVYWGSVDGALKRIAKP